MTALPNPASGVVKMAYTLPDGVYEGTIFLYDNSGKLSGQYIVDNHTDHLLLNLSGFRNGVYHYFIKCGNLTSRSDKLVISK